jgi:hypothetical protein
MQNLEVILNAMGYAVRRRTHDWCECLVEGFGEVWHGQGTDPDIALSQAVSRMLPSRLGLALLDAHMATDTTTPAVCDVPEPLAPEALDEAEPDESMDALPFEAPRILSRPAPTVVVASPVVSVVAPAAPSLEARFEALSLEVDEAVGLDFALLAPDLMRMQMLAWAATGRDLQDRLGDEAAERRTRALVQRLTAHGKRYWPGSVSALRQSVTPTVAGRESGFTQVCLSWQDVAEAAEARLEGLRKGRDEYGWADAGALPPPPASPESRLGDVRATLVTLLGPPDAPGTAFDARARGLSRAALTSLVQAARLMRWLRGTVEPDAWGVQMGRLRRAAQASRDATLAEALNPAFTPTKSWALHLRPAGARGPTIPVVPPVEAGEAAFTAWLMETGDRLDLSSLRRLLRPHRARLGEVDLATALAGGDYRSLRRRLRNLLDEGVDAQAEADETELDGQAESADANTVEELEPPTPTFVDRARALVQGKRALFVSNRTDPELETRLTEMLGLTLDWRSVDQPRSLQSAAERIKNGAFDFVLVATGFIDHSSEAMLREAIDATDVPMLRVGKGRLLACAQAIVRRFE